MLSQLLNSGKFGLAKELLVEEEARHACKSTCDCGGLPKEFGQKFLGNAVSPEEPIYCNLDANSTGIKIGT